MMTTEEWNDKPTGTQAMTAPEKIYMDSDIEKGEGSWSRCFETPKPCSEPAIEYTRTDIAQAAVAAAIQVKPLEWRAEAGMAGELFYEAKCPLGVKYVALSLKDKVATDAKRAASITATLSIPTDAQAALAARDKAVRDQALVAQRETEAKLAKAVKLIGLAVELARFDLNPKLCEDMTDFVTELKLEKDT